MGHGIKALHWHKISEEAAVRLITAARMPIRRAMESLTKRSWTTQPIKTWPKRCWLGRVIVEKVMNHTPNQNVAQTLLIGPGYIGGLNMIIVLKYLKYFNISFKLVILTWKQCYI